MIVDASALVAVLLREPEKDEFRRTIVQAREPRMSPINYIEAAVRADGLGSVVAEGFDDLFQEMGIVLEPIDRQQTLVAREAYRRFGKGNHPAKLNLGDCFAYALSKARGEPLLFKGNDFRQTDVEAVV